MLTLRLDEQGFDKVKRMIETAGKQVKFAAAQALTKVAQQAQSEIRIEMTRVFDRPTPYALNATVVRAATPAKLFSQVWLKDRHGDPQGKDANFLYPEVFGTPRGRKAFETALLRAGWLRSNEFVVPAKGYPLDAFGNVESGVIRSILSQAKAAGGSGFSSNVTGSQRSKATVRKRGAYFVPEPTSRLPRGIYQRIDFATGFRMVSTFSTSMMQGKTRTKKQLTYGANAIRMVFKIVVGKPRYRPRLRMRDIAQRVLRRDFQAEFDKALAKALATAK